ncbi:NUDIX domain-containing protein [Planctomyces sp. SH-PL62]|uniref:NUDIX domain-containing protein n=1 Tax=Planctomyces sp. SH-PL62 TaxID=1636152 RepID=UPI00078DCFBC|nr:NUDIX hydrolase [Planctomyces sp. SH-PL62]AMV36989.1 Bifunctional NMN adenylyltransferase/Nudix hydrolase [Planctomyces sp. SH-PL62]
MSSPPYCYPYPRPAVTTDLVVFAWHDHALQTLLIRRGKPPFEGRWAIPGGFLDMEEDAEAGARRELEEETGLVVPGAVEPLGFFARPGRDPRGRTITLAHVAVLPAGEHAIQGGDDAAEAAWRPVEAGLDLAFDHAEILGVARSWLREEVVDRSPMTRAMLPRPLDPADVRKLFRVLAISTRGAAGWIAAAGR